MNTKQQRRVDVLTWLAPDRAMGEEAAELLGVSYRHAARLLGDFELYGIAASCVDHGITREVQRLRYLLSDRVAPIERGYRDRPVYPGPDSAFAEEGAIEDGLRSKESQSQFQMLMDELWALGFPKLRYSCFPIGHSRG